MKIVNISGEDRRYQEVGFSWEFPVNVAVDVPNSIAEKLVQTGFFCYRIKGGKKDGEHAV